MTETRRRWLLDSVVCLASWIAIYATFDLVHIWVWRAVLLALPISAMRMSYHWMRDVDPLTRRPRP